MVKPFFIRNFEWLPGYYIILPFVSGVLLFQIPFYSTTYYDETLHHGWLLTLIIITAFLFVNYAILVFNNIYNRFVNLVSSETDYSYVVKKYTSDKLFIGYGIFFGLLNCGICFYLNPDGIQSAWSQIVLYWGYFLAGIVCGFAICGIIAIINIFNELLQNPLKLDYTNPDQCGGTKFLGNALLQFSGVTVTVGVLIAFYLFVTDWSNNGIIFSILHYFWTFFPFIMAVIVLAIPTVNIHSSIVAYKNDEQKKINATLDKLRNLISKDSLNNQDINYYKESYEFYESLRNKIHEMHSWPFSKSSISVYSSVFTSNAFAMIMKNDSLSSILEIFKIK